MDQDFLTVCNRRGRKQGVRCNDVKNRLRGDVERSPVCDATCNKHCVGTATVEVNLVQCNQVDTKQGMLVSDSLDCW